MTLKETEGYIVVRITDNGKLRVVVDAWGDPVVHDPDTTSLDNNKDLADNVNRFGGSNRRVLALPVKFLTLVEAEN